MQELGLSDPKLPRSVFRARDDSPDSVIVSHDPSLGSVFSSASGSGDRCSFGSDAYDLDENRSLASEFLRLAGRDMHRQSLYGSDLDSHRLSVHKMSTRHVKSRDEREAEEEEAKDPARHSFSLASKDCQTGGFSSEAIPKKHQQKRRASLDMKNQASDPAVISSPQLTASKKGATFSQGSGTFLKHSAPNYRHANGNGMDTQKGWSSERVPLPTNCTLRYANAIPFPFNNGRTLPSKWEDAEKWILSPGAGEGINRPPPQRRPKSKSGPLGTPGMAHYSSSLSPSSTLAVFDGMRIGNFMGSPLFSAADLSSGHASCGNGGGSGVGDVGTHPSHTEPSVACSTSVTGLSDLLTQFPLPSSEDEKVDGTKDEGTMVSPAVSRRDMATQMSPEGSTCSSPKERPSFSPPSGLPIGGLQHHHPSDLEIKDVQVDGCVTVTRWSKKHGARGFNKGPSMIRSWRKRTVESQASAWEVTETTICISKFRREEAKITAWENLQKAKAEAEIRKLEMKLEKMRTSSMDKIMKKLRSAQRKAQKMRSSVSNSQDYEISSTIDNVASLRKLSQMSSLGGCFTCPAF